MSLPDPADVVAAEWTDDDGQVLRGVVLSYTRSAVKVRWEGSGRVERVRLADATIRFITAEQAGKADD